jgi:pimeloyl-ACP methyl ester carboxylesterase
VRGRARYREAGAATVVDEFLEARSPGYRAALDRVLPGGFAQAVTDAGTWFDWELPGLLAWRFGETEAQRISQPVLAVLGGQSNALWPRFGETHRLLLAWLPHAEEYVLPTATHLMQLEHPPATAKALTEALAAFWTRHRLPPEGA